MEELLIQDEAFVERRGKKSSLPFAIRANLEQARKAGYSVNPGLILEGSWGMGAAVFDRSGRPTWALSLTGIRATVSPRAAASSWAVCYLRKPTRLLKICDRRGWISCRRASSEACHLRGNVADAAPSNDLKRCLLAALPASFARSAIDSGAWGVHPSGLQKEEGP